MGILQRFGDIMKSNINAMLDKCEDPAKMVDQTLRDLRESLAQVKKETASVMADEQKAKRLLDECNADITKFDSATRKALQSGNEEDAKTLLAKKQSLEQKKVSLESTYNVAHANAEKMRQMHDKLVSDIDQLETRKDAIKAKVATAKAQEQMNKATAGINTNASISAFERMEEKANKMLDAANAEAELNAGTNTADDIASKYTTGGDVSVDDELARMKAEMGL